LPTLTRACSGKLDPAFFQCMVIGLDHRVRSVPRDLPAALRLLIAVLNCVSLLGWCRSRKAAAKAL
jgi:hypothetical protein